MKRCIISIVLAVSVMLSFPVSGFASTTGSLNNFKRVQTYTDGRFTDVPTYKWYRDNVAAAYEFKLVEGMSSSTFAPESPVTIAETITLADRLHSIYYADKAVFNKTTVWYDPYVKYAIKEGIIHEGDFADYNQKATREQFAGILAKALPEKALPAINRVEMYSIDDVQESTPYCTDIYLLYNAGILVGNDRFGTFAPKSNIQRSEVAAIVTRMADPNLRREVSIVDSHIFFDYNLEQCQSLIADPDLISGYKDVSELLKDDGAYSLIAQDEDDIFCLLTGVPDIWRSYEDVTKPVYYDFADVTGNGVDDLLLSTQGPVTDKLEDIDAIYSIMNYHSGVVYDHGRWRDPSIKEINPVSFKGTMLTSEEQPMPITAVLTDQLGKNLDTVLGAYSYYGIFFGNNSISNNYGWYEIKTHTHFYNKEVYYPNPDSSTVCNALITFGKDVAVTSDLTSSMTLAELRKASGNSSLKAEYRDGENCFAAVLTENDHTITYFWSKDANPLTDQPLKVMAEM